MDEDNRPIRVAVVGACAAGKSTLVSLLLERGYEARHVAQEHSYVGDMWERISRPDVLIYLDVDLEAINKRRPRLEFKQKHLEEQNRRLNHAREHCTFYVNTNELGPVEVQLLALGFLADLD